jgi:hypothetical protein
MCGKKRKGVKKIAAIKLQQKAILHKGERKDRAM